MTYEIILNEADIKGPMLGSMRLGLVHEGEQKAELEYVWDEARFTATFHGNAPDLPEPAHPTFFLREPIAAIQSLKSDPNQLPTEVFREHRVSIEVGA